MSDPADPNSALPPAPALPAVNIAREREDLPSLHLDSSAASIATDEPLAAQKDKKRRGRPRKQTEPADDERSLPGETVEAPRVRFCDPVFTEAPLLGDAEQFDVRQFCIAEQQRAEAYQEGPGLAFKRGIGVGLMGVAMATGLAGAWLLFF